MHRTISHVKDNERAYNYEIIECGIEDEIRKSLKP